MNRVFANDQNRQKNISKRCFSRIEMHLIKSLAFLMIWLSSLKISVYRWAKPEKVSDLFAVRNFRANLEKIRRKSDSAVKRQRFISNRQRTKRFSCRFPWPKSFFSRWNRQLDFVDFCRRWNSILSIEKLEKLDFFVELRFERRFTQWRLGMSGSHWICGRASVDFNRIDRSKWRRRRFVDAIFRRKIRRLSFFEHGKTRNSSLGRSRSGFLRWNNFRKRSSIRWPKTVSQLDEQLDLLSRNSVERKMARPNVVPAWIFSFFRRNAKQFPIETKTVVGIVRREETVSSFLESNFEFLFGKFIRRNFGRDFLSESSFERRRSTNEVRSESP